MAETNNRNVYLVMAAVLSAGYLNGCTIALCAPFLPVLNQAHGLSSDMTGWMIGSYSLAHLACVPLISKNASKLGLYEMACWGVFLNALCTVIFGTLEFFPYPTTESTDYTYIVMAIVIRVLQGAGSSLVANGLFTLITLLFPEQKIVYLAYAETAVLLGVMTSPALGSGLYKIGGFFLVFAVVGGVELIVSIFLFIVLPRFEHQNISQGTGLLTLLKDWRRTSALIALSFGAVVTVSMDPILEPELLDKYGFTPEVSALCFLALSGAYSITAPLVGKLVNSGNCIDLILVRSLACILTVIGYLLVGPAHIFPHFVRPLWVLLIGLGLLGMGASIICVTMLNDIYPKEEQNIATNSTISGLWAVSYDSGAILGPVLSGSIARAINFSGATTILAGFGLLFALVFMIIFCITNDRVSHCVNSSGDVCSKICPCATFKSRRDYVRL